MNVRSIFAFAAAVVLTAACSSDSTDADAGKPVDAGKDVPVSPCGTLPAITCKPGSAGNACDTIAKPLQCVDGGSAWTCPSGTIPADQCGCSVASNPSLQPGDPCGGPGPVDAGGG
jgi:hypothetical protein